MMLQEDLLGSYQCWAVTWFGHGLELKFLVPNFSIKFKPNWNQVWFLELQFWNLKRLIENFQEPDLEFGVPSFTYLWNHNQNWRSRLFERIFFLNYKLETGFNWRLTSCVINHGSNLGSSKLTIKPKLGLILKIRIKFPDSWFHIYSMEQVKAWSSRPQK